MPVDRRSNLLSTGPRMAEPSPTSRARGHRSSSSTRPFRRAVVTEPPGHRARRALPPACRPRCPWRREASPGLVEGTAFWCGGKVVWLVIRMSRLPPSRGCPEAQDPNNTTFSGLATPRVRLTASAMRPATACSITPLTWPSTIACLHHTQTRVPRVKASAREAVARTPCSCIRSDLATPIPQIRTGPPRGYDRPA
jgi:hypothetical protein